MHYALHMHGWLPGTANCKLVHCNHSSLTHTSLRTSPMCGTAVCDCLRLTLPPLCPPWHPQIEFLSVWLSLHWRKWEPLWQKLSWSWTVPDSHAQITGIFTFLCVLFHSSYLITLLSRCSLARWRKVKKLHLCFFLFKRSLNIAALFWVLLAGLALVSAASQKQKVCLVYWVKGYHNSKGSSCSVTVRLTSVWSEKHFLFHGHQYRALLAWCTGLELLLCKKTEFVICLSLFFSIVMQKKQLLNLKSSRKQQLFLAFVFCIYLLENWSEWLEPCFFCFVFSCSSCWLLFVGGCQHQWSFGWTINNIGFFFFSFDFLFLLVLHGHFQMIRNCHAWFFTALGLQK